MSWRFSRSFRNDHWCASPPIRSSDQRHSFKTWIWPTDDITICENRCIIFFEIDRIDNNTRIGRFSVLMQGLIPLGESHLLFLSCRKYHALWDDIKMPNVSNPKKQWRIIAMASLYAYNSARSICHCFGRTEFTGRVTFLRYLLFKRYFTVGSISTFVILILDRSNI